MADNKKYASDENIAQLWEKAKEKFQGKESGKGLSSNDYTKAEKDKLAGLTKVTVDTALSSTSNNPISNKAVNAALGNKLNSALKGAAGGVAELDANGRVPSSQLPSYVDDVIDGYYFEEKFYSDSAHTQAITGESGKIYTDVSTNKTYRWSGSKFVPISSGGVALGETSATAYRGDRGKVAYDHSQAAHAPSDAEKNVQSDWNATDTNSDAYIKNKPVAMTGATASKASTVGLVPAASASAELRLLGSDGTWVSPMTESELNALLV